MTRARAITAAMYFALLVAYTVVLVTDTLSGGALGVAFLVAASVILVVGLNLMINEDQARKR